ncbi:hypothetical protein HPP92_004224 [Vanilla planifolia]|uniref:Uncharacterized protein n=1 Tax=Vanilla planifolia TaxID=51239 RepID=A0A835S912_VANPL|nr:hypothetical protein HPP92_004224 [Vanilla planifolia]
MLNAELARAKRRFEELLGFLSNNGEIGETISCLGILSQGNALQGVEEAGDVEEDEVQGGKENCMKLFGVLLKQRRGDARMVKRRRCDVGGISGAGGSWMGVSSPVGGGSKGRNSEV